MITTTLEHLDVQGVAVKAIDKGALDCTIKARMITVLHRGAEKETYDWKELDSWNV